MGASPADAMAMDAAASAPVDAAAADPMAADAAASPAM
jgi:hypothetical protein